MRCNFQLNHWSLSCLSIFPVNWPQRVTFHGSAVRANNTFKYGRDMSKVHLPFCCRRTILTRINAHCCTGQKCIPSHHLNRDASVRHHSANSPFFYIYMYKHAGCRIMMQIRVVILFLAGRGGKYKFSLENRW